MPDIADHATAHIEREAPYLIAASRKPPSPPANGKCLNCDADVDEGARFCDLDCMRDWEVREQQRLLAGGAP